MPYTVFNQTKGSRNSYSLLGVVHTQSQTVTDKCCLNVTNCFLFPPMVNTICQKFSGTWAEINRSWYCRLLQDERFGLAYWNWMQQGVLRISRSTVSTEALRGHGRAACSDPVVEQRPGDLCRRRSLRTQRYARPSRSRRNLLIRQFPPPDARVRFRLAVPPGNARVRVLAPVVRARSARPSVGRADAPQASTKTQRYQLLWNKSTERPVAVPTLRHIVRGARRRPGEHLPSQHASAWRRQFKVAERDHGWRVVDVLRSGHHVRGERRQRWRRRQGVSTDREQVHLPAFLLLRWVDWKYRPSSDQNPHIRPLDTASTRLRRALITEEIRDLTAYFIKHNILYADYFVACYS